MVIIVTFLEKIVLKCSGVCKRTEEELGLLFFLFINPSYSAILKRREEKRKTKKPISNLPTIIL